MFALRSLIQKPTDDLVLVRVGRGDVGAMNDCIETYGNLIWGIVKKYCSNHNDAEDLTQEIFSELWDKADRYDQNKAGESTFIGTIARRRSIDWLRKSGRHPETEPIADEIEESATQCSMNLIDHRLVLDAVETLPPDTQTLFKFHFESGMTHHEIASKTGIPLGTIKTRLRSGLLQLRKQLADSFEPISTPESR